MGNGASAADRAAHSRVRVRTHRVPGSEPRYGGRPQYVTAYGYAEGYGPAYPYPARAPAPPPAAVEKTSTIQNNINVNRDSVVLVRDDTTPTKYYLEFKIDTLTPATIQVFYGAVEKQSAASITESLHTVLPHGGKPHRIGAELGQRFSQCEFKEEAVDVAKYTAEQLAYVPGRSYFPFVIMVEEVVELEAAEAPRAPQLQFTYGALTPTADGAFKATVVRQKQQVLGKGYEIEAIYGVADGSSAADSGGGGGGGGGESSDCVICLSEPANTAVMPCRHMCLCTTCANELRMQTSKCPVCRTEIQRLLQIDNKEKDKTVVGTEEAL